MKKFKIEGYFLNCRIFPKTCTFSISPSLLDGLLLCFLKSHHLRIFIYVKSFVDSCKGANCGYKDFMGRVLLVQKLFTPNSLFRVKWKTGQRQVPKWVPFASHGTANQKILKFPRATLDIESHCPKTIDIAPLCWTLVLDNTMSTLFFYHLTSPFTFGFVEQAWKYVCLLYHPLHWNVIHIIQNMSIVSRILLYLHGQMNMHFADTICKPGWFILPTFGCYHIRGDRTTWEDAGEKCRQTNGNLVSWETPDEFVTMKTYLETNFCELSFHRPIFMVARPTLNNAGMDIYGLVSGNYVSQLGVIY